MKINRTKIGLFGVSRVLWIFIFSYCFLYVFSSLYTLLAGTKRSVDTGSQFHVAASDTFLSYKVTINNDAHNQIKHIHVMLEGCQRVIYVYLLVFEFVCFNLFNILAALLPLTTLCTVCTRIPCLRLRKIPPILRL